MEAQHTLFVDDNTRNIEGAGAVGLQTLQLHPGQTVEDKLARLLNP
jgi:FMN phosphatase YigB (HAD superfamily)